MTAPSPLLLLALLSSLASCLPSSGPLSASDDLERLMDVGEQQEMMEVALAASNNPELAERLLSRIWRSIQVRRRVEKRHPNRTCVYACEGDTSISGGEYLISVFSMVSFFV